MTEGIEVDDSTAIRRRPDVGDDLSVDCCDNDWARSAESVELNDTTTETVCSCRFAGNYSAPYYMISCLAVVLQQGMRCISNFRSS